MGSLVVVPSITGRNSAGRFCRAKFIRECDIPVLVGGLVGWLARARRWRGADTDSVLIAFILPMHGNITDQGEKQ